jgi:predicted nucleic acid-binding protein
MGKVLIYVDTNVFVDFYQSAEDPMALLDELEKHRDILVSTSQTFSEFHRNRASVLLELIKRFEQSVEINPHTTSILRDLQEHADLIRARDVLKSKAKEVATRLKGILEDPTSDPVARKFNALFQPDNADLLKVTPETVSRAHMRKLLGQPPSSPDKHTVGDEVIWEVLLDNLKEDLIVVTRDKTYSLHKFIIQTEYRSRTSKDLLLITKKVSEALKRAGQRPSPKLLQEEKQVEAEIREAELARRKALAFTGRATAKIVPDIRFIPPKPFYLPCPRCGTAGPWDSVKCRTCGFMDD